MKIAHLADLHLGFRRYERLDPRGLNQREVDCASAFRRCVDGIIARQVDLVLIAGDVFHSPRPPNASVYTFFLELQRLRAALPAVEIVIIAGNHDTPRTREAGPILPLFAEAGARVVMFETERVAVRGAVVTCVPSAAAGLPIPPPLPHIVRNLLLMHAPVSGLCGPNPHDALDVEATTSAGWDYIALGDYHSAHEVGRRAWYAGAPEYTTSDTWAEINLGPKGWLLVEFEPGVSTPRVDHVAIETRRHLDLPPVDALGMDAAALDRAIAERVAEFPVDDAIVRLVCIDVGRHVGRDLDWSAIRRIKTRATWFNLDLRKAVNEVSPAARRRRFARLDDTLDAFLRARPLAPDIDREQFVALGMKYLAEAAPDRLAGPSDPS